MIRIHQFMFKSITLFMIESFHQPGSGSASFGVKGNILREVKVGQTQNHTFIPSEKKQIYYVGNTQRNIQRPQQ